MPTAPHPNAPVSSVFFTVRLRTQGSDLFLREINLLRFAVARTLRARPVKVMAWTVLPDHMHCIWTLPPEDTDVSTRWRLIKTRFSRELAKDARRNGDVVCSPWQRRFHEHSIKDASDLAIRIKQCWLAPVRLGLVEQPQDWLYSSFAKARYQKAA